MRTVRSLKVPLVAPAVLLVAGAVSVALPGLGGRELPGAAGPNPRAPLTGRAETASLVVWSPGELPSGFGAAAAALPSVEGAAVVRSATSWLTAWGAATGALRHPPAGLAIPIEVAAVDVEEYVRFVPGPERRLFRTLGRDEALLGRTGAALRDIGPGGRLQIEGVQLRARAVVDDALIGGHEALVRAETAPRIGVTRPRYALVAPGSGVPRARAEAELRTILPGARGRIWGAEETAMFRHAAGVLPLAMVKEAFGEFAAVPVANGAIRVSSDWEEANIERASVPVLGTVECHRRILPQLRGALEEIVARGLDRLIDPAAYAGCYVPRYIGRSSHSGLSRHSWGIALDINASTNRLGDPPQLDEAVVEVFERWGFAWGGRWLVPDGMHFEFVAFPGG